MVAKVISVNPRCNLFSIKFGLKTFFFRQAAVGKKHSKEFIARGAERIFFSMISLFSSLSVVKNVVVVVVFFF